MNAIPDPIYIDVEYSDGQEQEDDVGYPHYVASGRDIASVTDGTTLQELFFNIREMTELYLEVVNEARLEEGSSPIHPRIIITLELPTIIDIFL